MVASVQALVILVLSTVWVASGSSPDCMSVVLSSTSFVGECQSAWSDLQPLMKPTQRALGYAWVKHKVEGHFQKKSEAQAYIDENNFPVVFGPSSFFYLVDHHHTLAALDHSGFDSVVVTVTVVCDERHLTIPQFEQFMLDNDFIYLADHPIGMPNALPILYQPSDLPRTFQFTSNVKSFTNDPWRAMSSYVRKVTDAVGFPSCDGSYKYCMRCYDRVCASDGVGIPFLEFKWGYFLNYASMYNTSYWPDQETWQQFALEFYGLNLSYGDVSTSNWLNAANYMIQLCRSGPTGTYELPTYIYGEGLSLPGYVYGDTKLGLDPVCLLKYCN